MVNVTEVHEFMNRLWDDVFRLNAELKGELGAEGFEVGDVEEAFGAYIFLDGEWRLMKYPHPAFEVKPQIEVGATPESYYFVVAVPVERASAEFIARFLEEFPRSFIYGAEDFLTDLHNWRRGEAADPGKLLSAMEGSAEKVFQFEANFDSADDLKAGLEQLISLGKEFNIFDI